MLNNIPDFTNNIPNLLQEYMVGSVAGQHFNSNSKKEGVVSKTQNHLQKVVISIPKVIGCFLTFIHKNENNIITIFYRNPESSRWDHRNIMSDSQSFIYKTIYDSESNKLSLRLSVQKKRQDQLLQISELVKQLTKYFKDINTFFIKLIIHFYSTVVLKRLKQQIPMFIL